MIYIIKYINIALEEYYMSSFYEIGEEIVGLIEKAGVNTVRFR